MPPLDIHTSRLPLLWLDFPRSLPAHTHPFETLRPLPHTFAVALLICCYAPVLADLRLIYVAHNGWLHTRTFPLAPVTGYVPHTLLRDDGGTRWAFDLPSPVVI